MRSWRNPNRDPRSADWLEAVGKTLCGAAMLWIATRLIPTDWELARGWTGMIGIVLLLHFGLLDSVALTWRHFGSAGEPLMRRPLHLTISRRLLGAAMEHGIWLAGARVFVRADRAFFRSGPRDDRDVLRLGSDS